MTCIRITHDDAGRKLPTPITITSRPFIIDPVNEFGRSCLDMEKVRVALDAQPYNGGGIRSNGGEADLDMEDETTEELLWRYVMEAGPEPFDASVIAAAELEYSRCKDCGYLPDNCVCRYRA
jgi:hypothetical protein